jgi:hypothetical protein
MKNLFILIMMICAAGCNRYEKTIYGEIGYGTLVGMQPIYREGKEAGCELTWKNVGKYNLTIVTHSFPPDYCDNYIIGVTYKLIIHK